MAVGLAVWFLHLDTKNSCSVIITGPLKLYRPIFMHMAFLWGLWVAVPMAVA